MSIRTLASVIVAGMVAAACSAGEATPDELTILSHSSFADGVTDETFAAFTEETGIEVRVLPAPDAGAAVNEAILTKDNPVADVLFGVDDTFLSRALEEDLFLEHRSDLADRVPDELKLDPDHRVTPIDFGDVCLNYDRDVITEPPASLDDLLLPEFEGALVVENPATSSPGLAFLLATIEIYGEDGWRDYWRALVDNGTRIVSDWNTAYYSEFSRYGGDHPLVLSYASSPPAEVIFSDVPLDTAPTGVVEAGCYRQIEFAGVLAGTDAPEAAGDLVDFMLSVEFQETIPLTWFVFPANRDAALPDVFVEHTTIPDNPVSLDPAVIDENRERWIEEWTEIVAP